MNALNLKLNSFSILVLATTALFIPLLIITVQILKHTHGVFAYPLDDSYIQLAVSKNLALYNVWGISSHEFASVSSSILYPLLLSIIFKITGVHLVTPFIVNLLVAI